MVTATTLVMAALLCTQEALPKVPVAVKLPTSDKRVYGKVHTDEGLKFLGRLIELGETLAPDVVAHATSIHGDPGHYYIYYSDRMVDISLGIAGALHSSSSGRLVRFSFGQLTDQRKLNVGIEECMRRARLFYELAGGKYELSFVEQRFAGGDEGLVYLTFEQVIPGERHPVGEPMECAFDRTYGLPEAFGMPEPPEYEKAGRVCEEFDAGQAAASAALSTTGWERVEVGVQVPRYKIPAYEGLANAMTERHLRLSREKKACLVYEISVNDASSFNVDKKRYERFVQAYVDAETGRTIAILPVYRMMGKPSTLTVPVADEGITWLCGKVEGTLSRVSASPPKSGKAVALRTAKGAWILGRYDAISNRLFYSVAGVARVYAPSKDLGKALRSYKPSKLADQPALTDPKKSAGSRGT